MFQESVITRATKFFSMALVISSGSVKWMLLSFGFTVNQDTTSKINYSPSRAFILHYKNNTQKQLLTATAIYSC